MTEGLKVVAVVASVREQGLRDFLEAWHDDDDGYPWDATVLVQDGGGPPFRPGAGQAERWAGLVRYGWEEIAAECGGELPPWLSRLDSGIKAWGFLKAVTEHGADVVVALDDDCLPSPRAGLAGEFVADHLRALYGTARWTTTIPGFVPRGLPYALPDAAGDGDSAGALAVMVNMGVWDTVPDRDAVHDLVVGRGSAPADTWAPPRPLYGSTRVMSPFQYWPMCGMNLAFRADAAPLMYFPRMGERTPFGRFDDIWCGVLCQRMARHLGWSMSVGRPIVHHSKASRVLDNLVREAPGIRANEELWGIVDGLELGAADDTPLKCMRAAGRQLELLGRRGGPDGHVTDPLLAGYLPDLGRWIGGWCDALSAGGWDRRAGTSPTGPAARGDGRPL